MHHRAGRNATSNSATKSKQSFSEGKFGILCDFVEDKV
jgi:hypothetical protein